MNKQHKIQAALDALKMTTPGDWWVDDFSDLKDGVGEFTIARDVDGSTGAQESANRKVIAASRELAEEVLRLREELQNRAPSGRKGSGYAPVMREGRGEVLVAPADVREGKKFRHPELGERTVPGSLTYHMFEWRCAQVGVLISSEERRLRFLMPIPKAVA
jgi:hypothetical protein